MTYHTKECAELALAAAEKKLAELEKELKSLKEKKTPAKKD